jgi:hypothetical protein
MARRTEHGLYVISKEQPPSIAGIPADWVDENLGKIVDGAGRVLLAEPGSQNAALARDLLSHATRLQAYRRAHVGRSVRGRRIDELSPALFEMMGLMLTAGMLDANLCFEKPVRASAKSRANLLTANVTPEQAKAAIRNSRTMHDAAEKLGISVRTLRRLVPKLERLAARSELAVKAVSDR